MGKSGKKKAGGKAAPKKATRRTASKTKVDARLEARKRAVRKKWARARRKKSSVWTKKKYRTAIQPSKIHGFGLFAMEPIPWGVRVLEYVGEKIGEREFQRREKFYDSIGYTRMFSLDEHTTIDALIGGNESVFINHSSSPNLGVMRENGRIFFFSLTDIEKGEELTFHYGYDV
jgi:SET domain-containing protein